MEVVLWHVKYVYLFLLTWYMFILIDLNNVARNQGRKIPAADNSAYSVVDISVT